MNLLLYIDPGTGSILFSIVIGLITTLYFVAKTGWIKLKLLIHGKKSLARLKNPIVVYSEGKQYWTLFKPVCDEFESRKVHIAFYTSSEDDPVLHESYQYVKPEYIGVGNKAFARLNMLEADVCLMTTPGLDVYQLKRSRGVKHYSHILHAVGDATTYRLFGLDYFDSVLLSGEYQKKDIRTLEESRNILHKELEVVGSPYMDLLKEKLVHLPAKSNNSFTVLLAPSWGDSGILKKYGTKLLDPLVQTGWNIIIRPHPQSKKSEPDVIEKLQKKYSDHKEVEWDFHSENLLSLSKADIMISDFSGVIFDYVFLFDRPFLYLNQSFDMRPYDADDIEEKPWQFRVLPEIGVELKESDLTNIQSVIENAVKSKLLQENRVSAKETAWQHIGESGKRTVDYVMGKVVVVA